ncbi:MAG: hypothetical protein ACJ789_21255 [Thermomicrobiales bacterium]
MTLKDSNKTWCSTCYTLYRTDKDRSNIEKALAVKAAMRAAGHDPAHGGAATERRSASIAEQLQLNADWHAENSSSITEGEYREAVLPLLIDFNRREIAEFMSVSRGYAAMVKNGAKIPHPRHQVRLANPADERPPLGQAWRAGRHTIKMGDYAAWASPRRGRRAWKPGVRYSPQCVDLASSDWHTRQLAT